MVGKPLIIIPARRHSRRIPNKNLQPLAGTTPLSRAIRCASDARTGGWIVVTNDWTLKFETATSSFPFLFFHRRPDDLATDQASMVDVVCDVLAQYAGEPNQAVLLVQPTQPLRRPEHLQEALRLLEQSPSIASVVETISVDKLYRDVNGRLVPCAGGVERDQDGTPTYACDGTVYGFRRDWFLRHRTFRDPGITVFLKVPAEESCRLDTPHDWLIASLLLRRRETVP